MLSMPSQLQETAASWLISMTYSTDILRGFAKECFPLAKVFAREVDLIFEHASTLS